MSTVTQLTCLQAVAEIGKTNVECARIANVMTRHPYVGFTIEHMVLAAYEKANGPIVGVIDWQAIMQWLITNGPAIMQLIMEIISLFGG